jgi:hypothetical protein
VVVRRRVAVVDDGSLFVLERVSEREVFDA